MMTLSMTSSMDDPQNAEFNLYAFVGYYGNHYMSFVNFDNSWYLCEDTKTKILGSFNDMRVYVTK